jgi:hypothetical protein
MSDRYRLKQFIAENQLLWDHDRTREAIRFNFSKVTKCQTAALGAEVFASSSEQRIVYHTCKSKCCPTCGQRATQLWQRKQWATLPDIPYAGIVFTMPDVLWPIFQLNRSFLDDLPALGAHAIKELARAKHGRSIIMVVTHTFGRRLNFHPHLHILASATGFSGKDSLWRREIAFSRHTLMSIWRRTLIEYLKAAHRHRLLPVGWTESEPEIVLERQQERWWNIYVSSLTSKSHFLRYAARYVRRLPVSEQNLSLAGPTVQLRFKNTRTQQTSAARFSAPEFLAALGQHVPDRYRHAVRYFDLWGSRVKETSAAKVFSSLGQDRTTPPTRLGWATSIKKHFGENPLVDSNGEIMRWSRRIAPTK